MHPLLPLLGRQILPWLSLMVESRFAGSKAAVENCVCRGVGILVDRRGIDRWWGGVLLLLCSGAVYAPSKRWRNTEAQIHVEDGD